MLQKSRRSVLRSIGVGGVMGMAGCLLPGGGSFDEVADETTLRSSDYDYSWRSKEANPQNARLSIPAGSSFELADPYVERYGNGYAPIGYDRESLYVRRTNFWDLDEIAIVAIDKDTMEKEWESDPFEGPRYPVIGETTIVSSSSAGLRGLDKQTGEKVWQNDELDGQFTPVKIAADGVFFQYGSYLYSVDAATGDVNWRTEFETLDYDVDRNGLAVANGTLYAGWRRHLHALSTATSELQWSKEIFGSSFDTPRIADEIAVVDDRIVISTHGSEKFVTTLDGEVVWSFDNGRPVTAGAGRIVAPKSNAIHARDVQTGDRLWSTDVPGRYDGSVGGKGFEFVDQRMVGNARRLYVPFKRDSEYRIMSLDASSGEILREYSFGGQYTEPPLLGDRLYVSSRYDDNTKMHVF